MPMNKRTESIRLKHLQDIYYEKLQGIAYDVYDEQLHNLIIRPEELDTDIHLYFRHTLPSLQDWLGFTAVSTFCPSAFSFTVSVKFLATL